jgi:hypothetical protein
MMDLLQITGGLAIAKEKVMPMEALAFKAYLDTLEE